MKRQDRLVSRVQQEAWVRIKVDPAELRELMRRQDGRPLRDFALYFGLLAGFAAATIMLWGSWPAVLPLLAYSILYSTGAQSREHETGHGTAFRTKWLNRLFFEITSFMVVRETFLRTHSHDAHHRHTIIVEKDPEIVTPAPPNMFQLAVNFLMLQRTFGEFVQIVIHATGRLSARDRERGHGALPAGAPAKARLWLAVMAGAAGLSYHLGSWIPVLLVGPLPTMLGGPIKHLFAVSQHVGLARDVLAYRLNTRTIYLGPVLGFLYMNMQYHLEHHLYPNVPYYNLPRLHELIRDRCPPAYDGLWAVYRELIPVLLKQRADPSVFIRREIPAA